MSRKTSLDDGSDIDEVPFQRMNSAPNPRCCMKRASQCTMQCFNTCAARETMCVDLQRRHTSDLSHLVNKPALVRALSQVMPEDTADVIGAIANCTNTIIGAGCLAIPKTIGMTGVLAYHGMVAGIFMVTLLSLHWLIRTADVLPADVARNYEGIANYFLGVRWSLVISFVFFFGGLSLTMAYIILITTSLAPVLSAHGLGSIDFTENLVRFSIGLGICWPLTLMRDISGLKFTSTLAIMALGYTVLFITATSFQNYLRHGHHSEVELVSNSSEIFSALAMSISAYSCHIAVMPIYESLGTARSPRLMMKIVVASLVLSLLFYEIIGLAGYLQFGPHVDGNVLRTIALELGPNIWVTVATASIAVTLTFSVPIIVWPLRSSILSTYQIIKGKVGEDASQFEWQTTTTAVMLAVLVIATVFPDVKTALSIGGSIGGSCIVFIYPAAFYLTVVKGIGPSEWNFKEHWPQLLMMIAGVFVGVLCFGFTVHGAMTAR